jgi:hypothetical protein
LLHAYQNIGRAAPIKALQFKILLLSSLFFINSMDNSFFQQFGFDNSTIMAAAAFQKAFPLPTGSQITPSSLTSLLPYASMLSFNFNPYSKSGHI